MGIWMFDVMGQTSPGTSGTIGRTDTAIRELAAFRLLGPGDQSDAGSSFDCNAQWRGVGERSSPLGNVRSLCNADARNAATRWGRARGAIAGRIAVRTGGIAGRSRENAPIERRRNSRSRRLRAVRERWKCLYEDRTSNAAQRPQRDYQQASL